MNTSNLKKLVSDFNDSEQLPINKLGEQSEKLSEICSLLDISWSGSPLGHHAYYYYGDFSAPPADSLWNIEWGTVHGVPEGWNYYQGDEIKSAIETAVGFTIKDYSKSYEKILSSAQNLKENVLIELSDFEFDGRMSKEKDLYSEIESFNLGSIDQLRADYINGSRAIGSFMSRDSKAITAGKIIPSHITIMAGVSAAKNISENIGKFISLLERFIKQMDKKGGLPISQPVQKSPDAYQKVERILNKFQAVARQLTVRHSSRSTLEIKDEYDVQDLLHSILKIEFEDIRAEEWTPSYAGSSTRMDFLLKQEEIVIEVKIAGDKLKDKDVGQQLILDIAHYKEHPACKTLYCFIYDPKFVLTKHSSLKNDLEKKHGELDVKIFIRPLA